MFRIRGPLDVQALDSSLNRIVARHEVFRTSFVAERDDLFQVVADRHELDMPVVVVSGEGSDDTSAAVDALIHEEISRPFDLGRGPLIRCRLLELSGDDWILIVVLHHIISDLRTKDLFGAELSEHYRRCISGQQPELDKPTGQYAEYARWHRDFLDSPAGGKMCSFWHERLRERSPFVTLPGEFPRPAAQSLNGTAVDFLLPEDFTRQLKALSREHGANLFLTLLTTFFIMVYRYSGKSDVTVGVPFTNRRQAADKDLMGCFMNILPIAVDIGEGTTFVELLGQIRTRMLEGHRNQEVPLETIVKHVRPDRDARYNPIFQVGFTFEHPMSIDLSGVDVEPVKYHSGGSQLDLFPVLWEANGEVRGHIEYCSDLYSEADASMFVANFKAALKAILADPTQAVAALPILDEGVRRKIEVEWNDTRRDYPADASLKNLFEGQVSKTPDAVAVVFGGKRLTYSELNSRCNRLAHFLSVAGVGPDVAVGIFMDRSMQMLEAIYAVVKAGGAYVPFDPGHPPARTAGMLEDAQVQLILTTESLQAQLSAGEARTIAVDSEWAEIERLPDTNPDVALDPESVAYIIFTSGSTGRPKGAVNSHRGICNRLFWMQDEFGLVESDSVLQKTPITFDVSVWEMFWPLIVGARLVIADPGSHRDPSALVRQIREHGITTVHFVPSMLQAFLANANMRECTSIRRVVCSGEALPPDLVGRFFSAMDAELYNLYGPTEAAVDVTSWRCTPDDVQGGVPIGKPIANTQIYILDDNMFSVPIGVPGELHIGGVQVAKGYVNNAQLTDRSFVTDPFSLGSTSNLYKTGDIARYQGDGTIEYLGRRDSQVQVRGFRVELGGIEALLCEHPGVAQAAVVVKDFGDGDSRIIAYVVPHGVRAYTVLELLRIGWEAPSRGASSQLPNGLLAAPMPNGLMMCHLNPTETDFLYEEVFSEQSYMRHGISLPEEACVFDVGANIGVFSVFAASTSKGATVYAFEPIPPVFDALETNALIHDLNIIPIERGLSDHIGSEKFTFYPHVSILSGRYADADEDRAVVREFLMREVEREDRGEALDRDVIDELLDERLRTESVVCGVTTVSEVMRERGIDHIDLLKIDVEGSEQEVLGGIEESDWKRIHQICVEVHERGRRLEDIVELLRRQAFDVAVERGSGAGLSMVYARREGSDTSAGAGTATHDFAPLGWEDPVRLTEDLRQSISARLPDYMIPSAWVLVDELPLTPNGKVDQKALPAYEPTRSNAPGEYSFPQPGTETELARLWAEVLKVDRVGAEDNFFGIGGNSLLGVYLVGQMEDTFQREVSVVKLFEHPTIRTMAAYLDQGDDDRSFLEEADQRAKLRSKARRRRRPDQRA